MNIYIKKYNILLILFILVIVINSIYKIIKPNNIDINNIEYTTSLENKYNELLKLNNIDIIYKKKYINTYIIYKDIYKYKSNVTISKGSNDYISIGNPVIYNNVLVGVISKVYKDTSIVDLLSNKNTLISVKINNEIGILKYKNNSLIIEGINNYGNVFIGDKVYTSGIGNILDNIFIGVITNIKLDNKGIEKIIYIDNPVNIEDINYLQVLGDMK